MARGKQSKTKTHTIHICTDRHVPADQMATAAAIAIKERADNLVIPRLADAPMGLMGQAMAAIPHPVSARMAVLSKRLWRPGRTLKVKLLTPTSSHIEDRIEHYANVWSEQANISFKLVRSGKAEIRVGFDMTDGSWSYLGTEALQIKEAESTMNFGWLTDNTAEHEFSRVILHEFGHALGAIHEHNHPDGGIPWNKPAVYAYYKQTNGWSKADVDQQVFAVYSRRQLNAGQYDPSSIMHYAIPPELLQAGAVPVPWNRKLSARDKTFIRREYP